MGSYKISSDALALMERSGYDIIVFYYDPERNVMIDECGFTVFDIFDYIKPSVLFLFKKNKQYMTTWTRWGDMVELIYPEISERYVKHGW